jgi:ABC-type sugar transport system permease subunit
MAAGTPARRWWLPGILFATPAMIVLVLIFAIPIAQTLAYSFTDWRGGVRGANFVALENYVRAFQDSRFRTALAHNAILLIVVPIEVLLGAFLASVMREKIYGWRFYRFMVMIPWIISITIAGYVWIFFLSPTGIVNALLRLVGLGDLARPWLADPNFALPAVMLVLVWRDTGFAALLFYSRLLAVDNSIYEAAALDGAKRWRRFIFIDLPLLAGVIRLFVVLMTIWLFSFVFNYVYVMTGGGPGYATTVVELEIFRNAFRLSQMGYGAAISILLLLVTLPILILQVRMQLKTRGLY